jgi:hypothetical protein
MTDATSGEDALAIIRYDWLHTGSGDRLHFADLPGEDAVEILDEGGLEGPVKLACGRTAAWVCIPGVFSRMGAERCTGCCRALGYPAGAGSPKNVPELRLLLGLG